MKQRLHLTLEATTIHQLNCLQKKHSVSLGQAVDLLARTERERNEEDMLAERVAAKIVEKLKKG